MTSSFRPLDAALIESYLGRKWVAGAHDCWSFARKIWHDHFGLQVNAVDVDAICLFEVARAFDSHHEYKNWVKIDDARDRRSGDACLLGRNSKPNHVGVWVVLPNTSGVLHCMQHSGVVFHTTSILRRSGWRLLSSYRHHSIHHSLITEAA